MCKLVYSCISATEINTHHSKSLKTKEASDCFQFDREEISQVTKVPLTLDLEASQAERTGRNTSKVAVGVAPGPLDLNSNDCIANNSACDTSPKCAENSDKPSSLPVKYNKETDSNCMSSVRIGLDLNAEDIASLVNQDPFYPYQNNNHLKVRDISECGSSTGPVEEKDSMRLWKETKPNGFLSSSHGGILTQNSFISSSQGGIPPIPKQHGRKSKNGAQKKRMELAKRESVDRFAKIAAPSGLLNELNPGIINCIRNRKQVYSIIEAIVKSGKREQNYSGSKQSSYLKSGIKDTGNFEDQENTNDSGIHRFIHSYEDRPPNTLRVSMQTTGYSMPLSKSHLSSADGDSSMVDREDDALALKLSSSTKASESACMLSNEESTNFPRGSSLSVKAASVASQWLELLHQDFKGRLSALRRSKKRVRAVISTELPFLISKEFSSGQENDPNVIKHPIDEFSSNATAAHMHQERWNILFNQMDKSLTEEEKQHECWLNQVKEMQLHCDHGLQYGLQHPGMSEQGFRLVQVDSTEKELAIKAAAASIYSTYNFLGSKENVSCC